MLIQLIWSSLLVGQVKVYFDYPKNQKPRTNVRESSTHTSSFLWQIYNRTWGSWKIIMKTMCIYLCFSYKWFPFVIWSSKDLKMAIAELYVYMVFFFSSFSFLMFVGFDVVFFFFMWVVVIKVRPWEYGEGTNVLVYITLYLSRSGRCQFYDMKTSKQYVRMHVLLASWGPNECL